MVLGKVKESALDKFIGVLNKEEKNRLLPANRLHNLGSARLHSRSVMLLSLVLCKILLDT